MTLVQKRKIIGTYETQKDAMIALADYNKNPYDLNLDRMTFEELYERWSDVHFPKVSESNVKGYKASYRLCSKIEKMKITDIKLDHLQMVVDESGKNTPTLKKLKILFGLMYDYAVMHEICTQDKRDMVKYVDISQAGNPNSYNRKGIEVGIGIVLILAFIGIMNYMNTFVVNVQSRMTELSVMESIGMTPKQLLGMLVREGVLYAGGAWLVTLTVGMGVTYLLYESMNYRGIAFSVPLLPLLFALGISLLVCTMVPVLTWIVLEKNGTVVERIKGVE